MKILEKPVLPREIFAAPAKPALLAQAVRVFLANQRQGTQSALTRAGVSRTRHKLYKQKGTGGARHGDRKAPIFVGGGVAFAPKPRDYSMRLSAPMRKAALHGALTLKAKSSQLVVVSGLDKLTGKTKELAKTVEKNTLIVTDKIRENVHRAGRNIAGVTVLPFNQLNTYEVLRAKKIILMEEIFEKPKTPKKKTR
ncbi:MAG: 50S ribosomal protein L4 [Patescibacteria group bacterium]|nr:50S ribosomal protein L4 [Patescibacteria group bacterium]MCL5432462.1 50S ribosomal protein L4 [Patescibacteria group bacterium]